jgi:hypothetical protein
MSRKPLFGAVAIVGTFLGLVVGFGIGFGSGLLNAGGQARQQQLREERELLEPIVASDPAFAEVTLLERSIGGYELIGVVPKQADNDRLRERVVRAFGEKRAEEIVRPVMVQR